MVCLKSADQLERPVKYLSTSLAGEAPAKAASSKPTARTMAATSPKYSRGGKPIPRSRGGGGCPARIVQPDFRALTTSLLRRRGTEDLPRPIRLQRPHQTRRLHGLHQARRPVVADLEPALHPGNRALARLGDDAHGLIVERIGLGVAQSVLRAFLVVGREARHRRS